MFSFIVRRLFQVGSVDLLPLRTLSVTRQGTVPLAVGTIHKIPAIPTTRETILGLHTCHKRYKNPEDISDTNKHNKESTSNLEKLLEDSTQDVQNEESIPSFPSDDELKKQNTKRNQSRHAFRPRIDPKETSLLLFPGQGSQFVGMARNLLQYPNVNEMFEVAGQILRYNLLDLCLNGPKKKLDLTVFCQAAILVTSLAAVEKLKAENPKAIENCISATGFSVGEYAALVFAGAMSFEEAVEVVKVRAEAMQRASEIASSGMMTVFLGADHQLKMGCHTARLYCRKRLNMEDPVCEVANYLYPECKVIAGHTEALDFIETNKNDFGIRRTKRLPVSGAFHTKLMKSAQKPLERILGHIKFETPIIPVHSNVTSRRYWEPESIGSLLVDQVVSPVKWEQTMHVLYARRQGVDFPYTYELGPGSQLGALLKMTNTKAHKNYHPISV